MNKTKKKPRSSRKAKVEFKKTQDLGKNPRSGNTGHRTKDRSIVRRRYLALPHRTLQRRRRLDSHHRRQHRRRRRLAQPPQQPQWETNAR